MEIRDFEINKFKGNLLKLKDFKNLELINIKIKDLK